jgi:2-polyprenyl-3-methyl-5-hydroxy-6-metoxy-1,4-benzoquinol methylase
MAAPPRQLAEESLRFLERLACFVMPRARALDLGAGAGDQARFLAAHGASVVAIERAPREVDGVEWRTGSIEEWCSREISERYDVILSRNCLHLLDPDWVLETLMPTLATRTRSGAVVAIETFFAPPEPAWETACTALFRAAVLADRFGSWQRIQSDETVEEGEDHVGIVRRFSMTRVMLRKSAEV